MTIVKQRAVRHFRDVFHWSPAERLEIAEMLAAAFGMAVPVLLGLVSSHAAAGFLAALGGLAVSRVEIGGNVGDHVRREIGSLLPVFLAAAVAVALAHTGRFAGALLVTTAVMAALVGGASRPMAVASTRFIIFLLIVAAVPDLSLHDGAGLLVMIVIGAAWTSALGLGFAMLTRGRGLEPQGNAPPRQSSAARKLDHLRRSLSSLTGWHYTLRVGSCLSVAAILQWVWPHHHFHWIGLTVALLTPRRPESSAVGTTQRTLGTAIGVLLAGLVLRWPLPAGALVVLIGMLAGARSHLKRRNYLAYSVVMTPLVVIVIDAGRPPELSLLTDRLVATLIGGILVTVSGLVFRPFAPGRSAAVELGR